MPYYPDADNGALPYDNETYWENLVSEYSGIPLHEVYNLDLITFMYLRREAFIHGMSQTKEGREWLEKAKLYNNTEADRDALKALAGRIGRGGD